MKGKRIQKLLIVTLLVTVLSTNVCASPAMAKKIVKRTAPSEKTSQESTEESTVEDSKTYIEDMVKEINKQRKKAGVSELTNMEELNKAAEIRAKEISKTYSHTRPSGTNWNTVLADQGIKNTYWGENICNNQKTVKETMQIFMDSQGHKDNILRDTFDSVGIARIKNKSDSYDWVQIYIGT